MYLVYILHSPLTNRYYIGSSEDVESRLKQHNTGEVRSTKAFRPWVLVLTELFETRTEARKRENRIKRYKSGRAFQQLVRAGTEAVKRDRL